VLPVLLSTALCGCGSNSQDIHSYVPSAEKLRDPEIQSAAFIVEARHIRGIYGNTDVDSVIYMYDTAATPATEFWSTLGEKAANDDWTLREEEDQFRKYVRVKPKTGQQRFHSVEEVRVAFLPESNTVIVAWVQADPVTLPTDFPTDGPEGKFANEKIWPRFERQCVSASENRK